MYEFPRNKELADELARFGAEHSQDLRRPGVHGYWFRLEDLVFCICPETRRWWGAELFVWIGDDYLGARRIVVPDGQQASGHALIAALLELVRHGELTAYDVDYTECRHRCAVA